MDGHHDFTGIAIVALAAMSCGVLFARLKQPAIVGYILAGVLLGPSALGLVADRSAIGLLAELGIIMLLFVIGTELSVKRFAEVWRVALITTVLQVAGSVGAMLVAANLFGWGTGMAVLLGYAVALSSTAVVIKLLQQTGELDSPAGRLTVGVLIAQDMAVVPMMLSLNALTSGGFSAIEGAKVIASVVLLAALVIFLLKREIRIPYASLVAGHSDLGPLAAFAWCFGAAALAGLAGLSPGYGAFLIGLIIGNSSHGHEITRHAHSIQAVLLMVFFLSVGLLLDLGFLWANIGSVLLLLVMVTLFKTALNITALRLQRKPWGDSFLAGVALAQIGEFSFLLSGAGVAKGLLAEDQAQLVVAVTVLSLTISPLWLLTMRRLAAHRKAFGSLGELLENVYGGEARAAQRGYSLVLRRVGTLPRVSKISLPRVSIPRFSWSRLSLPFGRRTVNKSAPTHQTEDLSDTPHPTDSPVVSAESTDTAPLQSQQTNAPEMTSDAPSVANPTTVGEDALDTANGPEQSHTTAPEDRASRPLSTPKDTAPDA